MDSRTKTQMAGGEGSDGCPGSLGSERRGDGDGDEEGEDEEDEEDEEEAKVEELGGGRRDERRREGGEHKGRGQSKEHLDPVLSLPPPFAAQVS